MMLTVQQCVGMRQCLACVLLLSAVVGCGRDRGPERAVVSGTVAYKGKPVADGTIRFVPLAMSAVPMSGTMIVDGKYKVDGHGGVPIGTHKIQIEAFHKVPITLRANEPAPRSYSDGGMRQQYLPKRHNVDSQLQITIDPGNREITKNFDLTD